MPNTDLFSEETSLDRRLGVTEALSIVIGRIIGSGIFRAPGPIMLLVASVGMFYGVWIIGGFATLLGAFLYCELAAMMPRSGGPYAYLKAAYPPFWTFLRGWAMFFVSETASIVAVALVFAEYCGALRTAFFGQAFSHSAEMLIAFSIIWAMTAANCFGVYMSGLIQDVFVLLKLVAIAAVIAVCFAKTGNVGHYKSPFWPEAFDWHSLLAFFAAMRYGFFAYSGWEGATYVAEEIRNPRRNLPISIIFGISGVMLLFIAANSAYLFQLSPHHISASKTVADEAMRSAMGATGGILISLAIMINTLGNVSSQVMVKARTWYAMSRDGLFIGALGKIHPRYKTPNRALVAQAIWASVLLAGAALAERAYETTIDFFSFTSSVFNISTFAAVWVLRRRNPEAQRPYHAWGYPATLIIVLAIQACFMIATLITAFIPSLLGILLTSTGLLYYYRGRIGLCWQTRRLPGE
jgi:amino acid transporter